MTHHLLKMDVDAKRTIRQCDSMVTNELRAPRPTNPKTISINVHGSLVGGTPAQLAEQIARTIKPHLDALSSHWVDSERWVDAEPWA